MGTKTDTLKHALANSVFQLSLGAFLVSAIAASFMREIPYVVALGSTTMIASILLFSIAWVAYLSKDGVSFLPTALRGKPQDAKSWQDRVPSLGFPPPSLPPPPDAQGPDKDANARLLKAEASLRARISGISSTESVAGKIESQKKTIRTAGISCAILFAVSLGIQYLL